jgi:hypothetical protein
MTPGYAKRRDELPYLPYWSRDEVIINAHNFGGGTFSPAVNGKMPVAAWIPSLDTVGNGTTTLTDLAGSNDGTLTNMDAATDWVADTAAGGVRALDFDGVNDRVVTLQEHSSGDITVAMWVYATRLVNDSLFGSPDDSGNEKFARVRSGGDINTGFNTSNVTFSGVLSASTWTHVAIGFDLTNNEISLWKNGVLVSTLSTGSLSIPTPQRFQIGARRTGLQPFQGRIDDVRVFAELLATGDASDLYTAQRGGDAS